MPRLSTAIDRANTVFRAHGTPFRLRAGPGSRWLSIYESRPGQKVRERAARGYASRDDRAFPAQGLEEFLDSSPTRSNSASHQPCWPEICDAVVAFQRGQGVNMNLVGPFRGQGYFRLLPPDRPATVEDVRRFALHTSESLRARLQDPAEPLIPMATHRQGFRQKRGGCRCCGGRALRRSHRRS